MALFEAKILTGILDEVRRKKYRQKKLVELLDEHQPVVSNLLFKSFPAIEGRFEAAPFYCVRTTSSLAPASVADHLRKLLTTN